jgi:glycosyltransferase involved in cell wall biosynthesis
LQILIDGLSARLGGGVTYMEHILPKLAELDTVHQFSILFSPQYQNDLIDHVPASIEVIPVDLPAEPLTRRWIFLQTGLVDLLDQHRIDLFYAPAESSYLRIPVPFVMLSRNPSIYAMPSTFGEQRMALIKHRISRQIPVFFSLHKADRVVFVSKSFGQQITRQMRLNPGKTRVIYHGLSPIFLETMLPPEGLPTNPPYFLMVSTINPHKNFETLIRAYATLPAHAPPLLIAGKTDHAPTFAMLQRLVQQLNLGDRVHFLGGVDYQDLPGLYQGAIVSIFASRLETFGHPLVEAMASKTPVIASSLAVCQEICEDAALYFDPDDPTALAKHMDSIWHDEALRERMIHTGSQRAAQFSWRESARQLVEVFEELVDGRLQTS